MMQTTERPSSPDTLKYALHNLYGTDIWIPIRIGEIFGLIPLYPSVHAVRYSRYVALGECRIRSRHEVDVLL